MARWLITFGVLVTSDDYGATWTAASDVDSLAVVAESGRVDDLEAYLE